MASRQNKKKNPCELHTLTEGSNPRACSTSVDQKEKRKISRRNCNYSSEDSPEVKRHGQADEHCDAICGIAKSIVVWFSERKQDRGSGLVHQSVPETDGKNWNHPSGFMVSMIIEMENDQIAPDSH